MIVLWAVAMVCLIAMAVIGYSAYNHLLVLQEERDVRIQSLVLKHSLLYKKVDLLAEKQENKGFGSVHWEVEALAKRIEELTIRSGLPPVEWNRTEDGYITGIVHDVEVNFQGDGKTGARLS